MKNDRHTTSCYATNAFSERLPPLYILDSKAKYPENYQLDPQICLRSPYGRGQFGVTSVRSVPSAVAVRRKGDMTTRLWEMAIERLLLSLYPNTCRIVERCLTTNKILRDPLVVKTDSGPGRLCKEASSEEFRARMLRLGVYILIGLPSATSVNREMDQGYESFQPAVARSTQRVASKEIVARMRARKKA